MKWFDKLKENKKLHVVFMCIIVAYSFYFVMNMFFVFGEVNVCGNMNGTLIKDHGKAVCIDIIDIPLCEDSMGTIYRDEGNNSFNFSSIVIG